MPGNQGATGPLSLAAFAQTTPPGGPKVIPLNVDFTANTIVNIDFSPQQTQNKIPYIQSVYIDNSKGTAAVNLQGSILGQTVTCPAGAQLWTPLLLPNPPQLIASCSGGNIVPMFFLNVPMPFGAVYVTGTPVSDAALLAFFNAILTNVDAAGEGIGTYVLNPTAAPVNVNIVSGGSGANNSTLLYGNMTTGTLNGFSDPTSGQSMTGLLVTLSPDAANGVGENNTWEITGGGLGTIAFGSCYVPQFATAAPLAGVNILFNGFNTPVGPMTGAPLNFVWNGTTLTSGTFGFTVWQGT